MILGSTVWVDLLGHEAPVFPYQYPALFSMTAAFAGLWFFSITDRSAGGLSARRLLPSMPALSPRSVHRVPRGIESGNF